MVEQFAQQDAVLNALDDIWPADPLEREYWDSDDELGAWLIQCDVARDSVDCPLDGLTVGVKNNVAVSGCR